MKKRRSEGRGSAGGLAATKLAGDVIAALRQLGLLSIPDLNAVKELIVQLGLGAESLKSINLHAVSEILRQRCQTHTAGMVDVMRGLSVALVAEKARLKGPVSLTADERALHAAYMTAQNIASPRTGPGASPRIQA